MARPKLIKQELIEEEKVFELKGYFITEEYLDNELIRVVVSERGLYCAEFKTFEQAKEYIDNAIR